MTITVDGWFIRRAAPEEAGEALAILREAAQWLVDIRRPLWSIDSFSLECLSRAARAGELVLGYAQTQPVASMLLQPCDEYYWPDDPPGEALYVHKVAVRRSASGQHWADRLIAWAAAEAAKAGARFLRLDTANVPELLGLYSRLGFHVLDEEPRLVDGLRIHRLQAPVGKIA